MITFLRLPALTLRPYVRAIALTALTTGLSLISPLFLLFVIDRLAPTLEREWLIEVGLLGLALYGLQGFASRLQRIEFAEIAEDLHIDLRRRVFRKLMDLRLDFHRRTSFGDLVTLTQLETAEVAQFWGQSFPAGCALAMTLAGTGFALVVLSPELLLVALLPIPILLLLAVLFELQVRRKTVEMVEVRRALIRVLSDVFPGMESVKVYGVQDTMASRLDERAQAFREHSIDLARHSASLFPLLGFSISVTTLAVLLVGGWFVAQDRMTLGTIVAFYTYLARTLTPIRNAPTVLYHFHRARASSAKIFAILERDESLPVSASPTPLPEGPWGLSFEDVWFTYGAREPDVVEVLAGITLEVPPGARVAILGPSGAGKSTLGRLALRLFEPDAGRVTFGGVPLGSLDPEVLRTSMGYVGQEVFLFDASLEDNILLGEDVSPEA
ncbi:MAG: ABC transporter ATP-binding protein, partial [Myxococcota bacterium]